MSSTRAAAGKVAFCDLATVGDAVGRGLGKTPVKRRDRNKRASRSARPTRALPHTPPRRMIS